jgi:uncharacterized protein (DUF1501 family)
MSTTTRREFLELGLRAGALGLALPAAGGAQLRRAGRDGGDDRVLVVVELAGGNDGLNTLVPYADDAYHKARPALALGKQRILRLDDHCGLHPELAPLRDLYEAGLLAIVPAAGYARPNRSHFESMDIWHSADPAGGARRSGWLGRWIDAARCPGLQIGGELSLAMRAESGPVAALAGPESLTFRTDPRSGADAGLELAAIAAFAERGVSGAPAAAVRDALRAALAEGERLRKLQASYRPAANYEAGLGQRLGLIARMIDARHPARVFYATTGGYDTHANQDGVHANLHRQFARAVGAFVEDLRAHGHHRRVLLLAFSEFGRRVAENGSRGTDHGAAGPVFLAGGTVRGGIAGAHASLTDLDGGDLKFTTDFRSVYATVLEKWLGASSEAVLGARFELLPLLGRMSV